MSISKEKQDLLNQIRGILGSNMDSKLESEKLINRIQLFYRKLSIEPNLDIEIPILNFKKFDIVRFKNVNGCIHYHIIAKVNYTLNIVWLVSITSDLEIPNLIPIKDSRLFNTFFKAELLNIPIEKNTLKFCGIYDNKVEFNKALQVIKKFYKDTFKF